VKGASENYTPSTVGALVDRRAVRVEMTGSAWLRHRFAATARALAEQGKAAANQY